MLTAAVLLTMVSFAFFYHVHEGQIDMLVAALSISAFLLYPRWRGWPSAALLAVAVAMKVSPVLLVAVDRSVLPRLALRAQGARVRRRASWPPRCSSSTSSLYREYVREDPADDRRLGLVAVQPDAAPVLVEVPDRGEGRVGARLRGAAVPRLGRRGGTRAACRRRSGASTCAPSGTRVLLLAVVLMLLFSPLAWQMAYVWAIVPLALVLTAAPPRGKEWAVLVLAAGAALLSMRMWPYRVLDMTNIIGAAVTALCLMRYYLPLELEKTPSEQAEARRRRRPAEPVAGDALMVLGLSGAEPCVRMTAAATSRLKELPCGIC